MRRAVHRTLAAALLTLAGALAGCGGCGTTDEIAGPAERGGADPQARLAACAGLSLETAAELLDADPGELSQLAAPEAAITCAFRSRSDPARALAFTVRELRSDGEAQLYLEAMVTSLGRLSSVDAISGLGDAAYLGTDPKARRALVRSGATVIDLFEPTDPGRQRRALEAIVRAL